MQLETIDPALYLGTRCVLQYLCFWIKYNLDRSNTHPKFNTIEVRTHDLRIMTIHFMSLRCLCQPLGHQWLHLTQYRMLSLTNNVAHDENWTQDLLISSLMSCPLDHVYRLSAWRLRLREANAMTWNFHLLMPLHLDTVIWVVLRCV